MGGGKEVVSIFSFADISRSEETIRRTWDEFRSALASGAFSYCDLDTARLSTTFFKVFDEIFSMCKKSFEVTIESVLSESTYIVRAGEIKCGDPEPTHQRFIPNKKYITDDNRFSPPGIEWLYLAIGTRDVAETCALKECKASKGQTFGLCQFKLNLNYSKKTLVDLTIAKDYTYEEFNEQLEKSAQNILVREKNRIINDIIRKGHSKEPDVSDFFEYGVRWFAYTYVKLLTDQIFVPVETKDRKLMYSPFQCMAHYFCSLGYEGIVYSSTVYPEGKNVVLFDKDAANPFGDIKIINI